MNGRRSRGSTSVSTMAMTATTTRPVVTSWRRMKKRTKPHARSRSPRAWASAV